jgi:DnaJ homolog subfamily A member 2
MRTILRLINFHNRQIQTKCGDCHGRGEIFSESDRCGSCNAERTIEDERTLDVHIDKGMKHMQKIQFRGEGNHLPNTEQGDVVVLVNQQQHKIFQRSGDDLIMTKTINLSQAICGVELVVTHLDGRELIVRSEGGEIIKNDDLKAVRNEGMPQYKNPFEKGNLYIKFMVEFPENNFCSLNQLKKLESALPPRPMFVQPLGEFEEVDLIDYDPVNEANSRRSRGEAYNNSDDEEDGQPGVQCRTQ